MLSVIVPVYNVREYFDRCLQSLETQTLQGIEYILVDDGSTDGSGEICDRASSDKHTFKVIHKKNGGLMAAWMAGVKLSSGDYIGFVDSDDYVDVTMFEKLYTIAKEKQADIVMSNHMYVKKGIETPNKPVIEEGWYTGERLMTIKTKIFPAINQSYISPSRWNKLFKKSILLNNLRFCDPRVFSGEDVNIVVPCMLSCKSFYFLNEPLYYYVQRNQSISYIYKANLLLTYQILLSKIDESIQHYGIVLPYACWENLFSYYGFLWMRAVWHSYLNINEKRIQLNRLNGKKLFYDAASVIKKHRSKDIWIWAYAQLVLKNQIWGYSALLCIQKFIHKIRRIVGSIR